MTPVSTSGRTRFELLSAQARRRLTALTLLRSFVNFAMVIMLYALSPLHGSGGARTLLYFLLGVALFVSILFWQLQRIAGPTIPSWWRCRPWGWPSRSYLPSSPSSTS